MNPSHSTVWYPQPRNLYPEVWELKRIFGVLLKRIFGILAEADFRYFRWSWSSMFLVRQFFGIWAEAEAHFRISDWEDDDEESESESEIDPFEGVHPKP